MITGYALPAIETYKDRLNRRLVKLAKWSDSSIDDRNGEFRNMPKSYYNFLKNVPTGRMGVNTTSAATASSVSVIVSSSVAGGVAASNSTANSMVEKTQSDPDHGYSESKQIDNSSVSNVHTIESNATGQSTSAVEEISVEKAAEDVVTDKETDPVTVSAPAVVNPPAASSAARISDGPVTVVELPAVMRTSLVESLSNVGISENSNSNSYSAQMVEASSSEAMETVVVPEAPPSM